MTLGHQPRLGRSLAWTSRAWLQRSAPPRDAYAPRPPTPNLPLLMPRKTRRHRAAVRRKRWDDVARRGRSSVLPQPLPHGGARAPSRRASVG
eukprot:1020537-Prymnesium_polylepis.1